MDYKKLSRICESIKDSLDDLKGRFDAFISKEFPDFKSNTGWVHSEADSLLDESDRKEWRGKSEKASGYDELNDLARSFKSELSEIDNKLEEFAGTLNLDGYEVITTANSDINHFGGEVTQYIAVIISKPGTKKVSEGDGRWEVHGNWTESFTRADAEKIYKKAKFFIDFYPEEDYFVVDVDEPDMWKGGEMPSPKIPNWECVDDYEKHGSHYLVYARKSK